MSSVISSKLLYPVYRPSIGNKEKEYVNACLDSSWISSKGEFIDRFEKQFSNFVGAPYATSVCNGTVALHLALLSIGISSGDEVIVPSFTYVASANTIVHAGAKPIFVDSLETSWQMDPEEITKKITPRTKAVMVVHLYGHPCDMQKIVKICQQYKLLLIEDCAEAFGTYCNGMHVGSFGEVSTYSFFGNKSITTGEGGMVTFKNVSDYERGVRLKTQGVSRDKYYWHDLIAYNYRMTNICAAIGVAQLEKAETILAKKRQIAIWYHRNLQGLPLRTHVEVGDVVHSYWMYSILLDICEERDALRNYLLEQGIETRPFFFPVHQMPMYNTQEEFPVAESLAQRGINLPSYPDLSEEDVGVISKAIYSFFHEDCNL